jgi:hypothetical protein
MSNMMKLLLGSVSLAVLATALPVVDPLADDYECWSSQSAWTHSSEVAANQYTTAPMYTTLESEVSFDEDVPTSTLCDGQLRAETAKTIWETTTKTLDPPGTTTIYSSVYTGPPAPTCTVAEPACTSIMLAHPYERPDCQTTEPYVPCSATHCEVYNTFDPTLYYWPVTTVSGDFCAQDGSTVFAEPTSPPEPNKAVIDGYTFTSPTNYVSFNTPQGYIRGPVSTVIDHRGGTHVYTGSTKCGPLPQTRPILPITESFYSVGDGGSRNSFNFADLNTVPADAYNRQRRCSPDSPCRSEPIYQAKYTPMIPLPTEILNLEPEEWKAAGCIGVTAFYDVVTVALATPAPTATNKML